MAIPTPQPAGGGNELDDLFGPPAGDPLFAAGARAPAGFGPQGMPGSAGPPRPRRKKGPNPVLIAGIAGGGVGLLLILIVVLLLVFGKRSDTQVAQTTAPTTTPTSTTSATTTPVVSPTTNNAVTPPAPPPSAPVADAANATPTSPSPPTTTENVVYSAEDSHGNKVEVTERSTGGGSRKPLAKSLIDWHAKGEGLFRGAIAPEEKKLENEVIVYQMSWMTQVLPYLGYERIHKKFDFKHGWTEGANFQAAQYRIPQFLAPGDDRKTWEGYQFPNMGLTHFAGMSGVEETRQEVAATLERSHDRAGIFGYTGIAKESDITDGKGQTIMVIGSGELIGPWVAGGGFTVRGARAPQVDEKTGAKTYDYFNSLDGFGTRGQSGPQTMFADGSVRILNTKIDPSVFRAMCTMHGKETVDLKDAGETKETFATQDFDPFKNEEEITIKMVRRIGDGGDDDDDDEDSGSDDSGSDDSDGDDENSDDENSDEESDEDSGSGDSDE